MILEYNPQCQHPRSQYNPMKGKKINGKTVESYFKKVALNHVQIALHLFSNEKELKDKTFHNYSYIFQKEHNSQKMIIIFENDKNPNIIIKIKFNEKDLYKSIGL